MASNHKIMPLKYYLASQMRNKNKKLIKNGENVRNILILIFIFCQKRFGKENFE